MFRLIDTTCVVLLAAVAAPLGALVAPLGGPLAMVLAMLVGMVLAMAGAFLCTPVAGMFEVMIPGTWAGMVAGMGGAMLRTHLTTGEVAVAGGLLGLAVALYFHRLDGRLRGVQP